MVSLTTPGMLSTLAILLVFPSMSQTAGLSRPRYQRQTWNQEGDDLAGVRGWREWVIGRRLVPQLVARGHQVTATTTSRAKLGLLERQGAEAVVMDGLDAASVDEAVAKARPDAIVHEMTAISVAHAGKPEIKHPGPLVRYLQPAAQRGNGPPAGRRRGDRRIPFSESARADG
jgi:hypothetical protein